MTDGGMGKRAPGAEPPNRMKFSTAPVKTQKGEGGGGGWEGSDAGLDGQKSHFCTCLLMLQS